MLPRIHFHPYPCKNPEIWILPLSLYIACTSKSSNEQESNLMHLPTHKKKGRAAMGGFCMVKEDVTQNILSRLPALSFAFAACVNKSWKKVCSRILSRPKLASALSLNPSVPDAVKEVVDKVLSEPIRPDFAIACIGKQFCLELTHQLITEKLGSRVPLVTNVANGIIGVDALTDAVKEVEWESGTENDHNSQEHYMPDGGVVLVVGFVPGLKVCSVPLLRPKKHQDPQTVCALASDVPPFDKFLMDIKTYTASVSDCACPACIILFGDESIDMNHIIAKMDYELPEETVIVGDASGCFMSTNGDDSQNNLAETYLDAVALVFARDRYKYHGFGETQFYVALSTGLIPFGPKLEAVGVMVKGSEISWVTARMEGEDLILDGQGLLDDIIEQFHDDGDVDDIHDIYIGLLQQRERSNGSKRLRSVTSLTFYEVLGADNTFFLVTGIGIRPGDSFLFYHSDSHSAASSRTNAYKNLALLKEELKCQKRPQSSASANCDKKQVFGGLIFSCRTRSDPLPYSFPFSQNFPGVPVGGAFCHKGIGRASPSCSLTRQDGDEEDSPYCCLHYHSTVYLVMTYAPVP